jgi:type II secretory pathway predicted ATPase ExeA
LVEILFITSEAICPMLTPRRHPSSRPFMAAPRPQFYHPAKAIDAALHSVERAIRRAEGVALVVGPPGTGKSLLLAKVAEHARDDFDVAFLSGARICTRRALWQSILAAIGEPYRGDEGELRMAVVERIRGLAAAGSGLVLLVDEAHTLPTRLIEELRLLTNVPTPLPAVHIVLAGSTKLEELLGMPRMESLAQRVAVRAYLEPLDHAETLAYVRTQTQAAGLDWDRLFDRGCDDAVFAATDGVPRLINQLCDQALVIAGDGGRRVTTADIAAAWREIQRLPVPAALEQSGPAASRMETPRRQASKPTSDRGPVSHAIDDEPLEMIEFGGLDEDPFEDAASDAGTGLQPAGVGEIWHGPDVEMVFDAGGDPFAELFEHEGDDAERVAMQGPDGFSGCPPVSSREGQALARLLASVGRQAEEPVASRQPVTPVESPRQSSSGPEMPPSSERGVVVTTDDDADMVVIEEDLAEATAATPAVFAVRPGDYRSLFSRLRRGGR